MDVIDPRWAQLAGLMMAGAVILLGARWELRQAPWGPTAWRVMLIAFIVVVIGAVVLLLRGEDHPTPQPPPSADALAV